MSSELIIKGHEANLAAARKLLAHNRRAERAYRQAPGHKMPALLQELADRTQRALEWRLAASKALKKEQERKAAWDAIAQSVKDLGL